jgi:hypothetical protein
MSLDDPRLMAGLLGVAGPGVLGLVCSLAAWAVLRRRGDAAPASGQQQPSPRVGIGPALGFGLSYVLASYAWVGLPDLSRLPVGASGWAWPIMVLGTIAAVVGEFIHPEGKGGRKGLVLRWLGRGLVVAVVLLGPLKQPRSNYWDGTEAVLWTAGVGLWVLLGHVSFDRLSRRHGTAGFASLGAILTLGLVPAIFGAGVTAQMQIAVGLAASLAGVALAALIVRGPLGSRGLGGALTVWLAVVLTQSWQFVSEMSWTAFGAVAALPVVLAGVDLLPVLRRWPRLRLLVLRMVIVAGVTGWLAAAHVPDLLEQLTGAPDPASDYGY